MKETLHKIYKVTKEGDKKIMVQGWYLSRAALLSCQIAVLDGYDDDEF